MLVEAVIASGVEPAVSFPGNLVGGEVIIVDADGRDVITHSFEIAHPHPHRLNACFGDVKPHQRIRLGGAQGRQIDAHALGGAPLGPPQDRFRIKATLRNRWAAVQQ
jgi:hypothetical protein